MRATLSRSEQGPELFTARFPSALVQSLKAMKSRMVFWGCCIALAVVLAWLHGSPGATSAQHGQRQEVGSEQPPPPPMGEGRAQAQRGASATDFSPILRKGEPPRCLSLREVETYLDSHKRSAASLLAAAQVTGDVQFLREAMKRFPDNPRVTFAAWAKSEDPQERAKWLELMVSTCPNNSLPCYLSAADKIKLGDTDGALRELESAAVRPEFGYFAQETILDAQEAYRDAGYSEAESKVLAIWSLPLPHLRELKALSMGLADVVKSYGQAGQADSANAVLALGLQMSERIAPEPSFVIEDLVRVATQRILLRDLDPASPSPMSGWTCGDLLAALDERKRFIQQTIVPDTVLLGLSPEKLAAYTERAANLGELQASQWFREKYGLQ